jgi:EH domain-containing protein 1
MDILSITSANYSKQDEPLYKRWFEFADTDADGRLTGPDAVKFFSLSQLPRADLKQVWAVADVKRQGFLGFKEFITAMQVISMAQTGQEISSDMLKNAGRFFNLYNIVNLESMPILEAYRSEVSISNLPSAPSL